MTTFPLYWRRPPLTENQRWGHWAAKADVVKDVRLTGKLLARGIGRQERIEVTLVWIVPDNRRRDADNIVPTLKALCDGIVDAGVVPDDTPAYMVKHMPVIQVVPGAHPRMELDIVPVT